MRKTTINVGDRVAYRVAFLRQIGATTGDIPFMRGTVERMGGTLGSRQLAVVQWDGDDGTKNVPCDVLARVGSLAFTSEDA